MSSWEVHRHPHHPLEIFLIAVLLNPSAKSLASAVQGFYVRNQDSMTDFKVYLMIITSPLMLSTAVTLFVSNLERL